ncbi:ferrochelatase [Tessaracoccus coleopterorum]|uniref:ferrochelatase n=1 Tax=Tessaracoccus coleopterorum TaxID=2714950 RepID=UPI002F90AD4D
MLIGNRNWEPYIGDVVAGLAVDGHERVVALATSAYQSYSSCRQYCEDIEGAAAGQPVRVDKIDPFWAEPAFAEANARRLVEGVRALRGRIGGAQMRVLFVTHSIPLTMNELSATGEPADRYDAQHMRVAGAVAALAEAELGEALDWELTYCSRSGAPHVPWLEPDVNDALTAVAGSVTGVVVAPIGFISDHMEVAYDLDTEAAQTAAGLGLEYERAGTVGIDGGFVSMLADLLLEQAAVARGERRPRSVCQFAGGNCCLPDPPPPATHMEEPSRDAPQPRRPRPDRSRRPGPQRGVAVRDVLGVLHRRPASRGGGCTGGVAGRGGVVRRRGYRGDAPRRLRRRRVPG